MSIAAASSALAAWRLWAAHDEAAKKADKAATADTSTTPSSAPTGSDGTASGEVAGLSSIPPNMPSLVLQLQQAFSGGPTTGSAGASTATTTASTTQSRSSTPGAASSTGGTDLASRLLNDLLAFVSLIQSGGTSADSDADGHASTDETAATNATQDQHQLRHVEHAMRSYGNQVNFAKSTTATRTSVTA